MHYQKPFLEITIITSDHKKIKSFEVTRFSEQTEEELTSICII